MQLSNLVTNVFGKYGGRKFVMVLDEINEDGKVGFQKRNIPSNRFNFTFKQTALVIRNDIETISHHITTIMKRRLT